MQASSLPSVRQRSPALSDSGSDQTLPSGHAGRPQRPNLAHANTTGGSFVRLKRKNTASPHLNGDATPTLAGERSVDQVQHKTCFICYEDEGEDGSSHGKWVHPCKCSLVAHEDCLLHWISVSKPTASESVPVTCPQCAAPYTISQLNFPLLNLIEKVEDVWAKNVGRVLMVGAGLGTWTLLSLYGVWAIRKFTGDRVAEQRMFHSCLFRRGMADQLSIVLLRKATRWLTAPLVLPIMILSRTHILDSVRALMAC
jgi:hypothetical protein